MGSWLAPSHAAPGPAHEARQRRPTGADWIRSRRLPAFRQARESRAKTQAKASQGPAKTMGRCQPARPSCARIHLAGTSDAAGRPWRAHGCVKRDPRPGLVPRPMPHPRPRPSSRPGGGACERNGLARNSFSPSSCPSVRPSITHPTTTADPCPGPADQVLSGLSIKP